MKLLAPRTGHQIDEPVEVAGRPGVIVFYQIADDGRVRYGVQLDGNGPLLPDVDLDAAEAALDQFALSL